MANAKRKLRQYVGGSDAVALFLQECGRQTRPDRGVRATAVQCLRFFGPVDPQLKTPEAVRDLWAEFGDELSAITSTSWLHRELEGLGDEL